jgi:hypothetical protein
MLRRHKRFARLRDAGGGGGCWRSYIYIYVYMSFELVSDGSEAVESVKKPRQTVHNAQRAAQARTGGE